MLNCCESDFPAGPTAANAATVTTAQNAMTSRLWLRIKSARRFMISSLRLLHGVRDTVEHPLAGDKICCHFREAWLRCSRRISGMCVVVVCMPAGCRAGPAGTIRNDPEATLRSSRRDTDLDNHAKEPTSDVSAVVDYGGNGAFRGHRSSSGGGRPAAEAAANPSWRDAHRSRRDHGHFEEHALAPRDRPAQTEPRATAPDRQGSSRAARRARRRNRDRRSADQAEGAETQRAYRRPAEREHHRRQRLESPDPAGAGRARAPHPRAATNGCTC